MITLIYLIFKMLYFLSPCWRIRGERIAEWFKDSPDIKGTQRPSHSTSFPPSLPPPFLGLEYSCDRELTTSHINPSISEVSISSITKA